MKKVLAYFAFALIGGFSAVVIYEKLRPEPVTQVSQPLPVLQVVMPNKSGFGDFTVAAERSIEAVVHVKTEYTPKE